MQILEVRLQTAASTLLELESFYLDGFGLDVVLSHGYQVGTTTLAFAPVEDGRPFYHFALRVPRNRFAAAREWLAERTALLPDRESGDTTFDFTAWNAAACYALDPGDNLVELIAHHELPEESPEEGAFSGAELLGVCEIGLVVPDRRRAAETLAPLGVELWDGELDGPLAFLGGRDGVLILARPGRGWIPTGRPGEQWPVDVVFAGAPDAEVTLPGSDGLYRIRRSTSSIL